MKGACWWWWWACAQYGECVYFHAPHTHIYKRAHTRESDKCARGRADYSASLAPGKVKGPVCTKHTALRGGGAMLSKVAKLSYGIHM